MKSVSQFCFPDPSPASAKAWNKKEEKFSFVLTESSGERRWGYCHRYHGQCFCIISFLPCFSIFSSVLDIVIELNARAVGTTCVRNT
jgi:hypothetical protein